VIVGLDHAFLTIQEGGEDEARRFYGDVLGLEEIQRPEGLQRSGGVWFQAGGEELHLGTDDAHLRPDARTRDSVSAVRRSWTSSRNGSHSNRFDVKWDDRIEGRRRFYTRDPFGNRLELLADL